MLKLDRTALSWSYPPVLCHRFSFAFRFVGGIIIPEPLDLCMVPWFSMFVHLPGLSALFALHPGLLPLSSLYAAELE